MSFTGCKSQKNGAARNQIMTGTIENNILSNAKCLFNQKTKLSRQQAMYADRLLLSVKSHFWGCRFSKWCFEIQQQSFRRLLCMAVFSSIVFVIFYSLLIIGTDFYIPEIVFYSEFCTINLLKRICTDFKISNCRLDRIRQPTSYWMFVLYSSQQVLCFAFERIPTG